MQQRRDVTNDQFAMTPPGAGVPITTPSPSNNGAIHNSYGPPPQTLLKQNPNTAKNRFGNANTPDAYYGAAGYFGAKHPNPTAEYFGKYEGEFIAYQQKMSQQMTPFANQPSKHEFHEGKPSVEFPHTIKGEMHPGVKQIPTPVQPQQPQLHGKNVDFHYTKSANPHLAAQNIYNQHGPHNVNADGNHHMPMQYNSNSNQYFANEFGNANDMDYFEPKTASSQAQAGYYDMYNNSNNNGNEFNSAIDSAYTAPSNGQLPNEHCEHFGYAQYYDGGNQHHHHHHHPHAHPHSGNAAMPPMQTPQVPHQPNHIGHAANTMNVNHPQFHHGMANAQSYHAAQQINGGASVTAAHPPNAQMDNSNSSSDFNFLSNLANDFAPEYYQLS